MSRLSSPPGSRTVAAGRALDLSSCPAAVLGNCRLPNKDYQAALTACNELLANPPGRGAAKSYYYWYYASLALMQTRGEARTKWNLKMREHLIKTQKRGGDLEGSWDTNCRYGRQGGRIYSTALATLTLEVYYRYLLMYGGKTIPAK